MSFAWRLLLGVLIGGFLVLLLHPASNPYLLHPLFQAEPSSVVRTDLSSRQGWNQLPDPTTPESASLWMEVGLAMGERGEQMTKDQLLLLIEIAQAVGESDHRNAFWLQAEACFQDRLRNRDACLSAWTRAASREKWDDYQVRRLSGLVARLDQQEGMVQSWHRAAAIALKTTDTCQAIYHLGSDLSVRYPDSTPITMTNVLNGGLIRSGVGSIPSALLGQKLAEQSLHRLYPEVSPREAGQRLVLEASKTPRSRSVLLKREEVLASRWVARINPSQSAIRLAWLTWASVLATSICPSLFAASAGGLLLWVMGHVLTHYPWTQVLLRSPAIAVVALGGGLGLYMTTQLLFPALWLTLSLCTLVLEPHRVWPRNSDSYDPGFFKAQSLLATVFLVFAGLGITKTSEAWNSVRDLLNALNLDAALDNYLPLSVISLSLGFAFSSVWAFRNQRSAPQVAARGLVQFGKTCLIVGLAACLMMAPAMMLIDRHLDETLGEIFQNEPNYEMGL